MVGEGDGVDAHRGRDLGVLDVLDALDHDLAGEQVTEDLDVVPGERRVELLVDEGSKRDRLRAIAIVAGADDVREPDLLGAGEVPRPAGMAEAVEDRVEPELGRKREPAANVAFATTERREVDGDDDRLVAGRGRPVDHLLDQPSILPDVHLEPLGAVGNRCDLLDRAGTHRRKAVRQIAGRGDPGDRQFTTRIGDAGEAGGRQRERKGYGPTQQRRRRVDLGHVPEHARTEEHIVERADAAGQRDLVLGGTIDVVEDAPGKVALRQPTQIVDVGGPLEAALDRVECRRPEPHRLPQILEHALDPNEWSSRRS